MSIQSWKKKYFPITVEELRAKCGTPQRDEDGICAASKEELIALVDHSIKKFTGAKPKNLAKHGLVKVAHTSTIQTADDDGPFRFKSVNCQFEFDAYTCGLCSVYWWDTIECERCPMLHVDKQCNRADSAYYEFVETGNCESVIAALKRIKKYLKG